MKKEWGKLRENYRKTLAKREKATRSGAGNKKPLPTCNYFTELSFLSDSMSNRSCTSNIPLSLSSPLSSPASAVDMEDSIVDESLYAAQPAPVEIHSKSEKIKSTSYARKRKRSIDSDESADLLLVKALDKHLNQASEQSQPRPQEEDDDRLFCLSLVKTLKKLNGKKNALAKLKIQQVLFDIQFED